MVSLEWSLDRTDGVTLVTFRVESRTPRRVRVENRLDGPVWPPRRQGRPAAGWDETGFEGVVDAGGALSLGYATPGEPVEPPVKVVEAEAVADGSGERAADVREDEGGPVDESVRSREGRIDDYTPAGVVRALGDPVVPREAVPVPDAAGAEDSQDNTGAASSRSSPDSVDPDADRDEDSAGGESEDDENRHGFADHAEIGSITVRGSGGSLSARLAAIERRLAAIERS